MKTSTMLLLGAGAAAAYYMYRKGQAATGPLMTASGLMASVAPMPPTSAPAGATTVVVVDPADDDYGPSWGWANPVFGGRAWRSGGGGRGGHGGHHGGHH